MTRALSGLSVVVPVYDEEDNIGPLADELAAALTGLELPWEVVFVDDGSKDGTRKRVLETLEHKQGFRLVPLDRNQGQSAALVAGVRAARHSHVATLDGDLQNDPRDVPRALALLREHDVVIGRRAQRRDTVWRRLAGKLANGVRRRVLGDGASDTGCSLKLFPTQAFLALPRFDGMHRFLPALFRYQGLTVHEIDVNHRARVAGRSKYTNFARLRRTIFDLAGVYWLSKRTIRVGARDES
jgi:glycosyltransferase involved in cell wall biosynthesis